jgi:hypothetical protein
MLGSVVVIKHVAVLQFSIRLSAPTMLARTSFEIDLANQIDVRIDISEP